ncbi:polyamine ABC transporter substrate-binding protein [filamentous cyanobacterium CCP5]|nr:polyamine ABC transporter substrate-binding protein [filamentous cyanobacterium CCP5]
MQRRTFLAGAAVLPLLVAGCQTQPADLTVHLLEGSIPLRLLQDFRQRQGDRRVDFEAAPTLSSLYERLLSWQQDSSPRPADWATLGDYWLTGAIQQQLIQPIPAETWASWQSLDPFWRQLVTRDQAGQPSDGDGAIWGIPYRWGSLMMIYRSNDWRGYEWRPRTWADLLRAVESPLPGRIALPNQPRIVTAIALQLLGVPVNTGDLAGVADLEATLVALQQQARFYSSDHYLEPLLLEDVSLAVGWSTDILPLLQDYRQFEAVVPETGTLLSADVWVRPAAAPKISPLAQAWVDYCLDPAVVSELTIFSQGSSPRLWGQPVPQELAGQSLLTLTPEIQGRSEILLPLDSQGEAQLRELWARIPELAASL